ncbi:MAG: CBS domain-containing protein, partial [Candidatus Omnitrophota bacterium]
EKVMAKEVAALRPHDSLKQAIKLLADNNYGCIPIVNEANLLLGIVTQTDIIKALAAHLV